MEVKYSSHAVVRMIQRQITPQEVESLLADPDGSIEQSKDKVIVFKRMKGRKDNSMAVVSVDRGNNVLEVITVMTNFEVRE